MFNGYNLGPDMSKVKKLGNYAAILSITEVSLGSILHGLKIPFSGQFLSLNQILILTLATNSSRDKAAGISVSTVSAIIKSLSPAGKKLTPMLAISAQGYLYSLGVFIFGKNILGAVIGGILSSLWAFIQPLAIYYLLFGKSLIFMTDYYLAKIEKTFSIGNDDLILVLSIFVLIKILLAIAVVLSSYYFSESILLEKINKLQTKKNLTSPKQGKRLTPLRGAIKDLLNPLFLVCHLLILVFYFNSNNSYSTIVWVTLRPLAIGFLLFYFLRKIPLDMIGNKLLKGKQLAIFKEAMKILKINQ